MWRMTVLLILLALAVGAGGAVFYGVSRWTKGTEQLHARLREARAPIVPATYDSRELQGLPSPVQRYLQTVLREEQPLIAVAHFTHTGTFNMGETTPNWRRFSSMRVPTHHERPFRPNVNADSDRC